MHAGIAAVNGSLDRRSDIDLALIDFAMPGMNGAEVARQVQSKRPTLSIVFPTGYADLLHVTPWVKRRYTRPPV
jgi:CheY-like chemotaxis protein